MVPVPRPLLWLASLLLAVFTASTLIAPGNAGGIEAPMSWVFHGAEVLAVAAIALRVARIPHERAAWTLMGLGVLSFAAGDLYWTLALTGNGEPPYPSPADAGYLGFAPLVYAGGLLLMRDRFGRLPASLWLDGVIAGLAMSASIGALVFGAVLDLSGGAVLEVVTNLAYPLADLVLLSLVLGVLVVTGWHPGRTWALLAAGIAVFAVVDTIYLLQVAAGTYVESTVLDAGWPLGLVMVSYAAWQRPVRAAPGRLDGWSIVVVPITGAVACVGLLAFDHFQRVGDVPVVLATLGLGVVIVRLVLSFRENIAMIANARRQATTDVLTGLGNRRALIDDIDAVLDDALEPSGLLAIFDLDGFKGYNDSFGHAAGDALLARLGMRLAHAMAGRGRAYRMGGDEFCVLITPDGPDAEADIALASQALSERGERFAIGCSYGMVRIGEEATVASEALRIADDRMYEHKAGGRPSARRQATDALLKALDEREVGLTRLAAELHDVGKVAIPDAILSKRGPLDADEWTFMERHTLIGERILAAARDLEPVGRIVRSTHERMDGTGYPDKLAGDAIPIEARIVAVADAFDAMTTDRPYRRGMAVELAIAELHRCAGTPFDPRVVAAFCTVHARADERTPA